MLLKVTLLLVAAIARWTAFQPPVPPPSKGDLVNRGTIFDKMPRVMAMSAQISTIACLVIESVVLVAFYFPNAPVSQFPMALCPHPPASLTNLLTLSPLFILGIGAMLTSAVIRVWCYKALGRFFTYEVTIRPDHQLITSGPYAYVRHPSYTALVLVITGTAVVCFVPGSYIYECGILSTRAGWVVYLWFAFLVYTAVSLLRRGKTEDESLRKVFKDEWDQYSRAVPCRYVPGLV